MADAASVEAAVTDALADCYADPLLHVLLSYPWGSGALRGRPGPQQWQLEFLREVGVQVRARAFDGVTPVQPIQFSTASGHGIGKSALVAWLIKWIMDTRPFAKGVVTANTAPQLRTKTWAELAKWHGMSLTKDRFEMTSGAGSLSMYHREYRELWRVDGQTSREENSEAFAGLHAANSTPFYIFDEASGIPDKIFEVREGGLTDGEPMTFDFGNPTRNSGRFHGNMIGRFRSGYIRRFIDSRDVEQTNKGLFQTWAETYGEDSDFFKVRVKGQFPSSGSLQFIPTDEVNACIDLDVHVSPTDPLVMGVDVARFGDDSSVIYLRQGRDAESQGLHIYNKMDTMHLVGEVARLATEKRPDAIFVDGGGVGGPVVDRLRQLGFDVIEINFGSRSNIKGAANMRAAMWMTMRQAIKDGIRLPANPDLVTDLTGVEYGFNLRNEIQLERKEDMKRRGMQSPDIADALALTYAMPVYPAMRAGFSGFEHAVTSDYDPFA